MAPVTMRDVAKRARVSKTTVSHVLNGTRYVEPATETRVRQAMRELGYRPNLLARSFRRRETRTIGLLIPSIASPYWAELAQVIERAGYAAGYGVLLGTSNWSVDLEREYLQLLLAKQIDGIVLAATTPNGAMFNEILTAHVPSVVLNQIPADRAVSGVLVDNYRGGYLAGEYLARLGHRQVGCIRLPPTAGQDGRGAGFRQAYTDAGIALPDSAFIDGDYEYRGGETAVQYLLDRHPGTTAVFAATDHMALGVIKGLQRARRQVPDDVSVIGFDNISYATAITPELTTIAQPIARMGEMV